MSKNTRPGAKPGNINMKGSFAEVLNNMTFIDYETRLRLIAKTMFEWKGLPNQISHRFLEEALYHLGYACFYEDPKFGFMVCRCTVDNIRNIYNEPTHVTTVALNPLYESKRLEIGKDCVLIRNNVEMFPTEYSIRLFAMRLYDTQRSIDVNVGNQKFPAVILCPEKQKLSFSKAFQDVKLNEPVIFADKTMNIEAFKTLNMEQPFVADKLTIQKHEIWNEAMSFLGLNNANTDKKERLITDEVNSNNELIEMMSQVMLSERKVACEEIKRLFGIDLEVCIRNYQGEEKKSEIDDSRENGGDSNV